MANQELGAEANASRQDEAKESTIIVNGQQKVVTAKEMAFFELVHLAFPNASAGGTISYTITYRRGEGDKPDGTLVEGESVKIKERMVFNITATDKS